MTSMFFSVGGEKVKSHVAGDGAHYSALMSVAGAVTHHYFLTQYQGQPVLDLNGKRWRVATLEMTQDGSVACKPVVRQEVDKETGNTGTKERFKLG